MEGKPEVLDHLPEYLAEREIVKRYPELKPIIDLFIEQGMQTEKMAELIKKRNLIKSMGALGQSQDGDLEKILDLNRQIEDLDTRINEIDGKIKLEYLQIQMNLASEKEIPPVEDLRRNFFQGSDRARESLTPPDETKVALN